ncbi:MAG: Two component response regulator containing a CheY-like receiver domain and an DNA-binding [Thermoleophilia bacterium]|nr:Two component response regulator containing a CheY-like receiver domain and an DNA-binding [Thermoleophilia bacterium]
MSTIRILVADDQPLVRTGLRTLLEAEGDLEVVGEAASGADAVELVRGLEPHVVLMDIRMPVLDGIAATREIVRSGARTKVMVLTTFDLDEYVLDALRAGASGFVLKDIAAADLVNAVRVVAAGNALFAPAATTKVVRELAVHANPDQSLTGRLDELSPREREILQQLATGRSNAEIAASLVVSPATVKSHVANLLAKLGLRDRVHAVVFAYESGFVAPGSARSD